MANMDMGDLGSIMDVLRNNPNAVNGILGILQNAGITEKKPPEAEYTEKETEAVATPSKEEDTEKKEQEETEGEAHRPPSHKENERDTERLLLALRPFLSTDKCKRLDEIRRYMGLIRIFQSQGGKR